MREKNKKLPQQAGIENGCVMNIFGSPFALCVDAGNKNCVTADGSRLHLTVRAFAEMLWKICATTFTKHILNRSG